MKTVSVIVPVWNAKSYLKKCIDSILCQSYPEVEIVLVDDGSNDGSQFICDWYDENNPCINVIHKQNGGVSSARNAGIEQAKGDYIIFVDSDDWISENLCQQVVDDIERENAQYVSSCLVHYDSKSTDNSKTIYVNQPNEFIPYLRTAFSSCGAAFCRKILIDKGIRFEENLKCAEDAVFIREYFRYCEKIVIESKAFYYINEDNFQSISKRFYPDYAIYHKKKLNTLWALFEEKHYSTQLSEAFLCERVYWGMRNTVIHGKKNSLSRNDYFTYIARSIDSLYEFLLLDYRIPNRTLEIWKNMYKRIIKRKRVKLFCMFSTMEFNTMKVLYLLKSCVNKMRLNSKKRCS